MSQRSNIEELQAFLQANIIGQKALINRLLIALLADGHLLVEGAPGLAKTRAIKVLGDGVEGDFHRVQFTPDLLPADLTGTDIFRPQSGVFEFQRGPLFHNLILADEVNRAPAKVQSALLEAMGERQITIGNKTYQLPELFLVMATQNPIEQEGTYPLPEAQLDRFLLHVKVEYPHITEERQILHLCRKEESAPLRSSPSDSYIIQQKALFSAREEVRQVFMAENLETYILALIHATRQPETIKTDCARWIQYGASPRGTIALDRCSRAMAWIKGRDYVLPEDIHEIAFDALRHRIILSYQAQVEGITADRFIAELIDYLPVP